METYDRNVAIISSAVYGGILVIGMLLFAFGHSGEPFYRHPSVNVAIFSVFWFAFSPSLLFMGATLPWVCALCGSRAAALTFAVVPGGLFVLIGAYWILVNDKYQDMYNSLQLSRASPWSRNGVNVNYAAAAPYRMSAGGNMNSSNSVALPVTAPSNELGRQRRAGEAEEHFPSPAGMAEMMQREGAGLYYPPYLFPPPPPGSWSPASQQFNATHNIHIPAYTNLRGGGGDVNGGGAVHWPGYASAGTTPVVQRGYAPQTPVPGARYSDNGGGAVPTNLTYGGGVGFFGGPFGPSQALSPPPMQPSPRQRQSPGGYYVA